MYQPDCDDLIPRCAPKPSSSSLNEAIVRPSVPEISIVFSQPESTNTCSSTPPSATSYAAWKKQCLPQVSFPASAEIPNGEYSTATTRSSVYPMRTAAAVVPTVYAAGAQFSTSRETFGNIKTNLCVPVQHTSQVAFCNPTYTVTNPCSNMQYTSNEQRKSMDNILNLHRHSMNGNVLTICASTQTDSPSINQGNSLDIGHLATKEDVAQIRTLLVEMHNQQRHLSEIIGKLLSIQENTQKDNPQHKLLDASTQCDAQPAIGPLPQKRPHIRYDSIEEEDSTDEHSHHLQKKTNMLAGSPPKNHYLKPHVFPTSIPVCSNPETALPKSVTEQSMVMNELALKYLPNEKLSELLQDLHVSPVATQAQKTQKLYESPLKNIENYRKSPNDLSTASYKYLKKYRLLTEENNNLSPVGNLRQLPPANQQENMLDLENIRRQPKFM